MRKVQIILGPPGTGKTTTLLNIVEEALARGIPPERIAYLAFTRKAAYEAQERAMAQFGFDESRFPYFRTLHSLAFRELGMQRDEVMTDSHYRKFGKAMGIEFKGIYDENIGLHTGDGLGDKCSRIESLARMGLRSIDEQMSITNVNDLNAHAVKQYHSALLAYKKDNGVYDFTDMLEKYNSELPVDICIFDEAQDLSSAQYKMAITAASLAGEVYIAGDDDQAIFGWAGADVDKFLNLKGQKVTLPNSHRIPKRVHSLANDVVSRIKNRYSKKWEPRKQEGDVVYVTNEQEIDFSNPGTWMLLSRSKYLLYRLKQAVRQQGYAYTINNRSSLESEETRAIIAWEAIRKGKRISQHEAKNLINFFGFTVNLLKQDNYGVEDLGLPDAARQYDWMTMLKGIAPDEREYLRSCMRNGEKFSDKPRITISTIHQSKGGEADNLVLLTDMGKLSWENLGTDEENRVWYVALTRAKENLYLIQPRGLRYFSI
jgi:superfamily I DNA/RNA helicase|tara:strand:+ start:24220 stop:25680 length:1461 start_codon:yes stop_codon:yes gene_type:complete